MKKLIKRSFTFLLTLVILLGVITPAATQVSALETPKKGIKVNDYRGWAQDDPRWYNVKLNKCKELTFWHAGCAIVSYTKLLIQSKVKDTTFLPSDMNTWMRNNSGFTNNTDALADWKDLANISPMVTYGGYVTLSGNKTQKQNAIMQAIKDGYYLIIGVNGGKHWVVVDNATSLKKGYPVIWDTAKGCSDPVSYNVGKNIFDRYGSNVNKMVKYKVTNTKFTVKYNANGGKGSMTSTEVTYGVGAKLRANSFTKAGYAFMGWNAYRSSDKKWCYTDGNGKMQWYAEGSQPSGWKKYAYPDKTTVIRMSAKDKDVITLYAVWNKAYTVKYNANGGKGTMADTVVAYGVNTKLRANTFTRDGYTFGGWNVYRASDNKWYYRDAAGNGKWCYKGFAPKGYSLAVYKDATTVAKTSSKAGDVIRLHAVWNKAYTVKYFANGGKGTMADTVVTYGVNTKIRANTFTRDGYTFDGWNVYRASDNKWYYRDAAGNGKWCYKGFAPKGYSLAVYKNATTVAKTSSKAGDTIALYAVWKKSTAASTMAISNAILPAKKMSSSAAFTISGKITSNYNITAVTAKVLKADGSVAFSATVKPNAKTYSLYNLDSKMTFSKLGAGSYTLVITATDAMGTKTLVKTSFTCAKTNIKTSGMVYPSGTLTKGKTFSVKGTVSANNKITKVVVSVHSADGVKQFSATAAPNATSYNINKLDSQMTFRKLPAGKYIYRVCVTDGNGVNKYVISTSFTVA